MRKFDDNRSDVLLEPVQLRRSWDGHDPRPVSYTHLSDNKKDEAIAHYRKAIEIAPDFHPARNNLGTLYLGKSDFKAAEEQFREAVRLDQNEAQAYFNLSNVLMLTGRFTEAETTLAQGLQRRPDSAFGYFLSLIHI